MIYQELLRFVPQFLLSVHRRIPTKLWVVKKTGKAGIKLTLKNFTKKLIGRDMKKVLAN